MKRNRILIQGIGAVLAVFALTLAAYGADWQIVLPDEAGLVEKTAAEELQTHVKLMTGKEIPIRAESENAAPARLLLVGATKRAQDAAANCHPEPFKMDEILVKADGDDLILTGHERRGALYAVYTFLEDVCGCRWFTRDVSRIPSMPELSFPSDLLISYAPPMFSREMYNPIAQASLFSARNKGNGGIDAAHGGRVNILNSVHTFDHYISPDRYFDEHPDWFAELEGKRVGKGSQLCLTNEEMRKELTKNVLEDLRKNPGTTMIDISQNDRMNFCTCEKCRAVDEEEGSHAGTLVRFLNEVAADVEKEFPDVLVETLAYQYTRKPPKHVHPRDNIVIRLCTIECDFAYPLTDERNKEFLDDIDGWSKLARHLFIWDYVTNYYDMIGPHPNWQALAPNIRLFVDRHALGLFEEGEGTDFCEMKNWVLMKLMWNPNLDIRELMADFSDTYYGKEATPYIMEYWRLLEEQVLKSGKPLGCFYAHSWIWLDLDTLNAATVQMKKAEEQIVKAYGADSPEYAHFRRSRIALDSVWALRYGQLQDEARQRGVAFEGPADFAASAKEFANYCIDNEFHAPDLDVNGEAGVKWYQEAGNGEHTPTAMPISNSGWSIDGCGIIEDGELYLDGTEKRTAALENGNWHATELVAEFQIEPNSEGNSSFGVIYGAKDAKTYSYMQFDGDKVIVGNNREGEEPRVIFNKPGRPHTVGEKHTIHLLFQERFVAVYIDNDTVFQWLSYPCPDERDGKIGFFAEGGNVRVGKVYAAGKKLP